jgi:hypothetical protein
MIHKRWEGCWQECAVQPEDIKSLSDAATQLPKEGNKGAGQQEV